MVVSTEPMIEELLQIAGTRCAWRTCHGSPKL